MELVDYTYNNAIWIVLGTLVRLVLSWNKTSTRRKLFELVFSVITGSTVGFLIVDFSGEQSYSAVSACLCSLYGVNLWRGFERVFPSVIQFFQKKFTGGNNA